MSPGESEKSSTYLIFQIEEMPADGLRILNYAQLNHDRTEVVQMLPEEENWLSRKHLRGLIKNRPPLLNQIGSKIMVRRDLVRLTYRWAEPGRRAASRG